MIPRELIRQVRKIEIATRRRATSRFAGGYRSVFRGQGMEFDEVRPYQPGDDVRSIDWNVTARAGHPYIKRYVVEREMTVMLVVDRSASLGFGPGGRTKAKVVDELCTLLTYLAIGNGDRVGLVLATDRVEHALPPGKGRGYLYRIIRELIETAPRHRTTNLVPALDHVAHTAPRNSTVFLVSDFLGQPDDRLRRTVGRLARRHDTVAVAVGDPAEDAVPSVGMLDVVDPETGVQTVVDTGDPAWRAGYRDLIEAGREAHRRLFVRHGIDLLRLSTVDSILPPVLRFFQDRSLRLR